MAPNITDKKKDLDRDILYSNCKDNKKKKTSRGRIDSSVV